MIGAFVMVMRQKALVPAAQLDERKQQIRLFWDAYNSARSLRTRKEYEPAAREYERALEIDPQHEDSLYYLGSCLLEVGEYEKAVQVYERLVILNPRSNRGLSQLGLLLSTPAPGAVLNLERARQMFERVSEVNQEESGPFLRLGQLL